MMPKVKLLDPKGKKVFPNFSPGLVSTGVLISQKFFGSQFFEIFYSLLRELFFGLSFGHSKSSLDGRFPCD